MINLYIANITLLKCTRGLFYHLGNDRSMLNCFKTTKLGKGGPTKGFFGRIFIQKILSSHYHELFYKKKDNLFDILYTWYICLCYAVKCWWFHWVNNEGFVINWSHGLLFYRREEIYTSINKNKWNPILFNFRGKNII